MTHELSPSRLNLFADCQRCFWLELNRHRSRPRAPFPSLPSGMDHAIKAHFDRFRNRGALPPALETLAPGVTLVTDSSLLERARDWRRAPIYEDPSLDLRLRGAVDDLLRDPDGRLLILDYKTRGYPPQRDVPKYYARQLNLYALLFANTGYDVADLGLLLYYYPDRIQHDGTVVFETACQPIPLVLDEAHGLLERAVETLEADIPPPHPDCDFCAWAANDPGGIAS